MVLAFAKREAKGIYGMLRDARPVWPGKALLPVRRHLSPARTPRTMLPSQKGKGGALEQKARVTQKQLPSPVVHKETPGTECAPPRTSVCLGNSLCAQ